MDKSDQMNSQGHERAQLNPGQLRTLADLLAGKRRELIAAVEELNRHIVRKQDCCVTDAAEAASLREEAVRAAGIASQHRQTISEIDQALRRLDNGHYGISDTTGEPIGYDRLLLVPWARTGPE